MNEPPPATIQRNDTNHVNITVESIFVKGWHGRVETTTNVGTGTCQAWSHGTSQGSSSTKHAYSGSSTTSYHYRSCAMGNGKFYGFILVWTQAKCWSSALGRVEANGTIICCSHCRRDYARIKMRWLATSIGLHEGTKASHTDGEDDDGTSPWAKAQMAETPTLLPSLKFHDLVFGHDLGKGAFGM